MIKLCAVPLVSVGKVRFGMSRVDVRNIWGEYREFRKTIFSQNTADDFGFCHVFYDNNDCCEAIEIFDAEVFLNDQLVFPCNKDGVKTSFPNAKKEYDSYLDKEKSIGLYIPDEQAESILFGTENYYNSP